MASFDEKVEALRKLRDRREARNAANAVNAANAAALAITAHHGIGSLAAYEFVGTLLKGNLMLSAIIDHASVGKFAVEGLSTLFHSLLVAAVGAP